MHFSGPDATVIMATYNRGRHIVPSIKSVLGQTLSTFELLVVGDACTDDTEDHVRSIGDPRVKWITLTSRGGSQSFANNAGIRATRSPVVAYLGHDDIWHPDHLAELKRVLDSPDVDFAVAGAIYYMPPGCKEHWISGLFSDENAPFEHFFPPSSLAHRTTVVEKIGFWQPPESCRAPVDADFFLRAAHAGFRFRSTQKVTTFKFAAGNRYLSYVQQDSSEQEEMLLSFADPDLSDRIDRIVHEAKKGGRFMIVRHTDYSLYEPGQLAAENRSRKGLDHPSCQQLGLRPFTLRQIPGPRALDWTEEVDNGYRYQTHNPNPAVLLPLKSNFPVRICVQLKHDEPEALRVVTGSVNGMPFRSRPAAVENGTARLVIHSELRPDTMSVLRFQLSPSQCRSANQRGIGVGDITIRPDFSLKRAGLIIKAALRQLEPFQKTCSH